MLREKNIIYTSFESGQSLYSSSAGSLAHHEILSLSVLLILLLIACVECLELKRLVIGIVAIVVLFQSKSEMQVECWANSTIV